MKKGKQTTSAASRLFGRLLAVFTVLATMYSLVLPASTLTAQSAYCGLSEHVHTELCEPNCDIEEHTHTRQCYSNPEADVESEEERTLAFDQILSEASSPAKAAAIALSQVGTKQSRDNFQVLEDGSEAGYSRYGAWENQPYMLNMQTSFIRFVYSYAGADISSLAGDNVNDWLEPLAAAGLLENAADAQEGDLAFIDEEDGTRAGVVTNVSSDEIDVVEVSDGAVVEKTVPEQNVYGTVAVLASPQQPAAEIEDMNTDPAEDAQIAESAEATKPAAADEPAAAAKPSEARTSVQSTPRSSECLLTPFPPSNPGDAELGDYSEHKTTVRFFYRYPSADNQDPEWIEFHPGDDVTFKVNAEFKMNVSYENLEYQTIEDAEHQFSYPIPSFMETDLTSEGAPLEHTFENASGPQKIQIGKLYPCTHGSYMHIDYDQYAQLEGEPIVRGEFEVTLHADRESVWENPQQEFAVGDDTYNFKFDLESSYDDIHVQDMQKAKNPVGDNQNITFDENGNAVIGYQIYFDVSDNLAPDAIVDDWFSEMQPDVRSKISFYKNVQFQRRPRNSSDWETLPANSFSYVTDLEGRSDPLELIYIPTASTADTATHIVQTSGCVRAGFYLGTLSPDYYYRITYNCTYSRGALEQPLARSIRNDSRLFFGPKDSDRTDWEVQDLVNTRAVSKQALSDQRYSDDEGNLYLAYQIALSAGDKNFDDWALNGHLKDLMNIRFNGQCVEEYLSYISLDSIETSADGVNFTEQPVSDIEAVDNNAGSLIYSLPAPEVLRKGERYFVRYVIKLDRELVVKMTADGKDNVVLSNKAYAAETYTTSCPQSSSVNQQISHSEIVKKAKGDVLAEETTFVMNGDVYNEEGQKVNDVHEFTVDRNAIQYSIKINEDGAANVLSSDLSDALKIDGAVTDDFSFTGYAALNLFDGKQDASKEKIGTIWVKLPEDDSAFNLALGKYQETIERLTAANNCQHALSYELVYYVKNNVNADSVMLTNELTGSVGVGIGSGQVSVQSNISISNLIVTGEELSAKKQGVYYFSSQEDLEAGGNWRNGRVMWLVELSGTSISKDAVFTDTLSNGNSGKNYGDTIFVPNESVVGIYRGELDFSFEHTNTVSGSPSETTTNFGSDNAPSYSYQDFENALLQQTTRIDDDLYTVGYPQTSPARSLTIQFKNNYRLTDRDGSSQKLYILLQSTPIKEGGFVWEADRCNHIMKNSFTSTQGTETEELAKATFTYRAYDQVRKTPELTFAYQDGTYKKVAGSSALNSALYENNITAVLNQKIENGELSEHEIYDDWEIIANLDDHSPYTGTFEIVDTLSDNMDFVTVFALPAANSNIRIESVDVDGQKVTVRVSGVALYEKITLHFISRLKTPWDEVIAKNPPVERINHVDLYHNGGRIGIDNASTDTMGDALNKTSSTLEGNSSSINLAGVSKIEYSIDVNPSHLDLIENSDSIDLEDTYNPEVIEILPDTISITADGKLLPSDTYTVEFRKEEGKVIIRNLPDSKTLHITYSATLKVLPGSSNFAISNTCSWIGYGKSAPETTYSHDASNTIGGSSTSVTLNPKVEIRKVDANNATKTLPGAKFRFTPGTVSDQTFAAEDNRSFILTTDENGKIVFGDNQILSSNTWYKVEETEVPAGYDAASIEPAQYFYVYSNRNSFPAEDQRPNDGKVNISLLDVDSVLYLTFTNRKPVFAIHIQKSFSGESLIPGSYVFGVYDHEYDFEGTEQQLPLKKVTLEISEEEAASGQSMKEAVIDNLEIRENPYYVYELNADGVPVRGFVNAFDSYQKFEVVYPEEGNAVNYVLGNTDKLVGDRTVDFAIQNKPLHTLPETGGHGLQTIYSFGTTLLAAAGVVAYMKYGRKSH